eukprot:1091301-Ditylum_brightwellii.AAC.1
MANYTNQFSQEFQQTSCTNECNMMTREEDINTTTCNHDNATHSKSIGKTGNNADALVEHFLAIVGAIHLIIF